MVALAAATVLASCAQPSKPPAPAPPPPPVSLSSKLIEQASVGAAPLGVTAPAAPPPYSPLVIRSLALAALAALGYADDAALDSVSPLIADPTTAACLNMSKLNLYQCLAVAKPYYEDVFCLGEHVLSETGACLIKGAGLSVPPDPYIEALKAKAAAQAAAKPTKGSKSKRAKH